MLVGLAIACALGLSACGGPRTAAPEALPPGSAFDYQIGGAYTPTAGVGIVARDRSDAPVGGKYNICYLNAFQAQPGEASTWSGDDSDLILRDARGREVVDEAWGEVLLDISTSAKRQRIARTVTAWIDGCADDGFDAVEPDNLDSWTRSGHGKDQLLSKSDAVAFSRLLIDHAHGAGLAVAQKNASGLLQAEGDDIGFDFAIAEECGHTDECSDYADVYGDQFVDIEYTDNPRSAYRAACATIGEDVSVILRDRAVSTPDHASYRYERCTGGEDGM